MTTDPTTLDLLREKQAELTATLETQVLARNVQEMGHVNAGRILESITDFDNLVDPCSWRANEPGYHGFGQGVGQGGYGYGSPFASISDRDKGKDRPFFESEQDLRFIIAQARILATFNITGVGILDTLANYTVGVGFDYGAAPRRIRDDVPEALVDEVNAVIDETVEANKWRKGEREVFKRAVRDGDQPVMTFDHQGATEFRIVDNLAITEPSDAQQVEDWAVARGLRPDVPGCWTFGVDAADGDAERVYGYYAQWTQKPQDFDYLQNDDLVLFKRNTDRGVKRGLSDFYPAMQWINRIDKIEGNLAESAAVQAAIAWIKNTAKGVSQTQSTQNRLTSSDAQYSHRHHGSDRDVFTKHYLPGTTITAPNGQLYESGPGPVNAGGFLTLIQIFNRLVGRRWDMPEYMISGDASNANRASTFVAESPFVKATEVRQSDQIEGSVDLFWIALRNATNAGRFTEWGVHKLAQLKRIVKLIITAPNIVTRDASTETIRRALLHERGLLSAPTWSAEESLDFETEQAQGAEPAPAAQPGIVPNEPNIDGTVAVQPKPAAPSTESMTESEHYLPTWEEIWKGYG